MVKQVGSWILRATLGQGSFGEVYQAEHVESGKKVAVKVCGKQMLAKGQGRTLLQREIATMKALDHPNVLVLYEVLETTKRFYLVMELVERGELFDLIQENTKFTETVAKRYFAQLMEGLRYCHAQGVVHRDLKPQNILISKTDQVKIADFGFSRFQDTDESKAAKLKTQCGTPNYAAPEIFLGQGYDGFKTDVWSCGVILYVMLTGSVPFKPQKGTPGLQGVIVSIVQGCYSVPSSVSQDARQLIESILTTNPDHRATVDKILTHPWLGKKTPTFKIPRINVTDDAVRDSIVLTGDEIGFDSPQHRSRGATFSSRPVAQVFERPLTVDEMLGGGKPPTTTAFDSLGTSSSPKERRSPISFASPTSATVTVEESTSSTTRKTRSATTTTKPADVAKRTPHVFKRKHWNTPHWCFYCGKCIYGVGKQGFSCILCACPVHVKCVDSCSQLSCCEQYQSRQQK